MAGKSDQFKVLIRKYIGNLILTESKIHYSFPNDQFRIEGFSMPFKFDHNNSGGGVLIYIEKIYLLNN